MGGRTLWGWGLFGIAGVAGVLAIASTGGAVLVPGGGSATSDCYVEFDVRGALGTNKVTCTDGDPACDADGQCQGTCTFEVGVCLNQTNVAGCTPTPLKKALAVKGAPLSVVVAADASPVCGPSSSVPVALKGKKRNKRGRKKIKATAIVTGKPARDADRLVLLCVPRAGDCPTTTSTVSAPTTTSTTLPPAPDANALLTGAQLAAFSTLDPAGMGAPATITGVNAGDVLVAIARRPQNGFLYGLGFNAVAGTVQLYAVSATTGQATAIGTTGTFVDGAGTPVTVGAGAATRFGMDFNPAVDRVRVVNSAGQNFRMNPNTGAFIDGDLGGAAGSVAGLNMDGAINGGTTSLHEAAYTNDAPNTTVTTLYTLDQVSSALCIQNPPNNGTQTVCKTLTPAVDMVLGFDIPPGVNVPASNSVASGSGVAVVRLAGQTSEVLAQVDLTTGAIAGTLPFGSGGIVDIALQKPAGTAMIGLLATGTSVVRFSSAMPGTVATVTVTGIAAGETLIGLDWRPQTGQLFSIGINPTANTGTSYLLDPQTGAATVVGVASQIAFVDSMGNPIDLPLATAGWGFDFNPTVDRIRVVTATGLNFRVNPVTGAPVDGNAGTAGINPDSDINGATTSVDGTAYTNNFGQPLAGGVTTVYTLDAVSNGLYIQNPPNNGVQTNFVPITLGGAALDFTAVNGFDIPSDVRAAASGSPVTEGAGFAALTVGGSTHLYRIDLVTGAATDLGTIGNGMTGLAGLTVGQTAVQ